MAVTHLCLGAPAITVEHMRQGHAIYDPSRGTLRWARAGHLPPLLIHDRTARTAPSPSGSLLGVDPDAEYEEAIFTLQAGDTVLFFTDGLIERSQLRRAGDHLLCGRSHQ